MDIEGSIRNYALSIGLDTLGFVECRKFYELKDFFLERKKKGFENEFEEHDVERRINPFVYMEDAKTIISIAFPYKGCVNYSGRGYFSSYTRGMDYHRVLESYMENICIFIEEKLGGKAKYFVDSNCLPERHIAYLSGIGTIGRNNMLITEKYGSYIFLGEIIMNLSVKTCEKPWQDIVKFKACGQCERCLKACPTDSINEYYCNPSICMSYITQQKEIEKRWLKKLGGRLFGCDTCQRCCPLNHGRGNEFLKEFEPFDFMDTPYIEEIIYMDNKMFKERYSNTSCGWRGKAVLQRNAVIEKALRDGRDSIDISKIGSPKVRQCYDDIYKGR